MRTVIWFTYFWLYLICTLPKYLIIKFKDKKNMNIEADVHKLIMNWAKSLVKVTGSKVTVIGEEKIPTDVPVVFVSNHQSNFDIPLLLGYINKPKGFIAKAETEKMPIVGGWMRYIRCVFMDRSNPRAAVKAIRKGVDIVKSGYSLVIFPEGTRSLDGKLSEFKPGSFKLAMKAGAMIVPVTISGSYDIMKKGSMKIKAADVKITISDPVTSEGYESTESYMLREKIANIIGENL